MFSDDLADACVYRSSTTAVHGVWFTVERSEDVMIVFGKWAFRGRSDYNGLSQHEKKGYGVLEMFGKVAKIKPR